MPLAHDLQREKWRQKPNEKLTVRKAKKPGASGKPYEELCGRPLTETEEAEMNFNLVNFVETLIAMDRQHQAWLQKQTDQTNENT